MFVSFAYLLQEGNWDKKANAEDRCAVIKHQCPVHLSLALAFSAYERETWSMKPTTRTDVLSLSTNDPVHLSSALAFLAYEKETWTMKPTMRTDALGHWCLTTVRYSPLTHGSKLSIPQSKRQVNECKTRTSWPPESEPQNMQNIET